MTYNELLIRIYEVIEDINKENGKEPSVLFKELFNLLNLEKICQEYTTMASNLTKEEIETFSQYAKLDAEARRMFAKCYKDEYDKHNVKQDKFLKEYDSAYDYIAATLLNELGDTVFNTRFAEKFNEKINNVYNSKEAKELGTISIFKNLLYNNKNIGKNFRGALKEFELLSLVNKKNGVLGLLIGVDYDSLISAIRVNNDLYKIHDELNDIHENINDFNEENIDEYRKTLKQLDNIGINFDTGFYDVFRKLGSKHDWFDNSYYNLILNITSKDSCLAPLLNDKGTAYAAGLIVYYLQEKDFLDKIVDKENGVLKFKDISGLLYLLKQNRLDISNPNSLMFENKKSEVIGKMRQIIFDVMDGKIDIEKLNGNKKF